MKKIILALVLASFLMTTACSRRHYPVAIKKVVSKTIYMREGTLYYYLVSDDLSSALIGSSYHAINTSVYENVKVGDMIEAEWEPNAIGRVQPVEK